MDKLGLELLTLALGLAELKWMEPKIVFFVLLHFQPLYTGFYPLNKCNVFTECFLQCENIEK